MISGLLVEYLQIMEVDARVFQISANAGPNEITYPDSETLEELGMRGAQTWKENGGETLELVPCVNASPPWVDAVVRLARESTTWLDGPEDRSLIMGSPALGAVY